MASTTELKKRPKLSLEPLVGRLSANQICRALRALDVQPQFSEDDQELDEEKHLKKIKNKMAAEVAKLDCLLISGIKVKAGEGWLPLHFAKLSDTLSFKSSRVPAFGSMLAQLNGKELQLLVYHDEAVPGNVLSTDNPRKASLLYVTFKELGRNFIRKPEAWTTCGIITHNNSQKLDAGMSAFVRWFLRTLLPPHGSMLTCGEPVETNNGTLMLRISSVRYFSDEAALKATVGSKGASGTKPCHACVNLISKKKFSAIKHPKNEFFVTLDAPPSKLVPMTDQGLYELLDHVKANRPIWTKKKLDEEERLSGFNCLPEGLFQDLELRKYIAPSSCHFGPMHVYVSNGIANDEVHFFFDLLDSLRAQGLDPEAFQVFATSGWKGIQKHQLKCACNPKYFKDAGYKGSASHLLLVVPLLAAYAEEVVMKTTFASEMQLATESLVALAAVLVELRVLKSEDVPNTTRLRSLQLQFRDAHLRSYGSEHLKPKFHFQYHIPDQIDDVESELDEFALEKKHILYKHEIGPKMKTGFESGAFEKHCLKSLISAETCMLKDEDILRQSRLSGRVAHDPNLRCDVSASFFIASTPYVKGDVVSCRNDQLCMSFFEITAALSSETGMHVCIQSLIPAAGPAPWRMCVLLALVCVHYIFMNVCHPRVYMESVMCPRVNMHMHVPS